MQFGYISDKLLSFALILDNVGLCSAHNCECAESAILCHQ